MRHLQKINDFLEKILNSLGLICFGGLVLSVSLQIVTRLWLPWPVSWTEEISRFFFLYSIAFCGPIALKNRSLVFVDMLAMNLSGRAQAFLLVASDLLVSILCIIICWTTFTYIKLGFGQIAPASGLSMVIPYTSMAVLFIFLSIFSLSNWLRHIPFILKGGR